MGRGTIPHAVRGSWTVEVRPHPDGPVLVCPWCDRIPAGPGATAARVAVVAHLAQHARGERLPPHLRTCQCGEQGCRWHGRHRGCDGLVVLVLSRDRVGRIWRLADTCRACASATAHAAAVSEPAVCETPGAALVAAPLPRTGSDAAAAVRSDATVAEVAYGYDLAEDGSWWCEGMAYG